MPSRAVRATECILVARKGDIYDNRQDPRAALCALAGDYFRRERVHRSAGISAAEDAQVRAGSGSAHSRSDRDDGLHHAQLRLHGLRHAVLGEREVRSPAADGREVDFERRQAHLHLHAARGPEVPRRSGGALGGLHRFDRALGEARCARPAACRTDREVDGRRRQNLHADAEAAVCAHARCARQAVLQRALHHAGARRQDRRVRAGQGNHRLGSLQVRERGMGARQQGGVTSRTPTTCRARSRLRGPRAARS